jgi:AraC-like DNA-binding protein
MANSKKSSKSNIDSTGREVAMKPRPARRRSALPRRMLLPKTSYPEQFDLVEPQINAEGVHIWPFDAPCPVDVLFLTVDDRHRVRMNRHGYFEVLYLCSGSANCHIQDRLLPFNEGDLAIIGSTLYHRIECQSSSPVTIAALFFEPDLIRCDGASDSAEYLTPFLLQDEEFPHVIPAETGVPRQALDLMLRIRSEIPASSARGRLTLKTYLKMLLILLVNQYAPYAGTVETYQRQQQNIERLRPLFSYLGENCGDSIHVKEAARICCMSESHFMSLFKRVTGLSFVTYCNHFRIERAQELLARTDESMASITQQVGFCDQSYFGTVFRRIVGMTPAIYRRRVRNNTLSNQRQPYHTPRLRAGGLLGLEPQKIGIGNGVSQTSPVVRRTGSL